LARACRSLSAHRARTAFLLKAAIPFVFSGFWMDPDNVATNHVAGVSGEIAIEGW
jgi:hypothetical protein